MPDRSKSRSRRRQKDFFGAAHGNTFRRSPRSTGVAQFRDAGKIGSLTPSHVHTRHFPFISLSLAHPHPWRFDRGHSGLPVFSGAAGAAGNRRRLSAELRKIAIVPPFALTERSGKTITNHDLAGKIWVADFIYTTCPGPCPLITASMAKIQEAVAHDPQVQLVTFTVDPQTDTPAVLAKYADQFGADPNRWWFLTGPEKPLYDLIRNGFLQVVQDNQRPAAAGGPVQGHPQHVSGAGRRRRERARILRRRRRGWPGRFAPRHQDAREGRSTMIALTTERDTHAARRRCRDHRDQRRGQPFSFLARLFPCARRMSRARTCFFFPRSTRCSTPSRPSRWSRAFSSFARERIDAASRVDVHRVCFLVAFSRRLHHQLRAARRDAFSRSRARFAGFIFRCSSPTSSSPSWCCR